MVEKSTKILIPIAIIIAGILIAGAIIYVFKGEKVPPSEEETLTKPEETQGYEFSSISPEGEPLLGNPEVSLTMIEYTDFQCPFCARHANTTFFQIKKEYVDTGKLKIVFKNFPLPFYPFAQKAAEASECVLEQGKFWQYKEILFKNQEALSIKDLKKYARDLGLDIEKFNDCLDSGKFEKEVKEDSDEGREAEVSGTPTFFVKGEKIVGAQPFSEFQKVIEEKLK